MIKQTIVLLNVNLRQDTHVFQIIRVLLLVAVEMVNWMQEKIAIQSLTVLLHAKLKMGTHVPITFVSTVEIVFYK